MLAILLEEQTFFLLIPSLLELIEFINPTNSNYIRVNLIEF